MVNCQSCRLLFGLAASCSRSTPKLKRIYHGTRKLWTGANGNLLLPSLLANLKNVLNLDDCTGKDKLNSTILLLLKELRHPFAQKSRILKHAKELLLRQEIIVLKLNLVSMSTVGLHTACSEMSQRLKTKYSGLLSTVTIMKALFRRLETVLREIISSIRLRSSEHLWISSLHLRQIHGVVLRTGWYRVSLSTLTRRGPYFLLDLLAAAKLHTPCHTSYTHLKWIISTTCGDLKSTTTALSSMICPSNTGLERPVYIYLIKNTKDPSTCDMVPLPYLLTHERSSPRTKILPMFSTWVELANYNKRFYDGRRDTMFVCHCGIEGNQYPDCSCLMSFDAIM